MFRTSFGFEMLHKARRRARLKALKKKKEKKLARYHAHFNKITKRNAVQSPFLRLPAEIRNLVYGHVFNDAWYGCDVYTIRVTMRVLHVCRQIHHDTALLPYQLATFDFAPHANCYIYHSGHRRWEVREFMENRTRPQILALGRVKARVADIDEDYYDSFTGLSGWMESRAHVFEPGPWWAAKLGFEGYSS